jgi:hypothetical protein
MRKIGSDPGVIIAGIQNRAGVRLGGVVRVSGRASVGVNGTISRFDRFDIN